MSRNKAVLAPEFDLAFSLQSLRGPEQPHRFELKAGKKTALTAKFRDPGTPFIWKSNVVDNIWAG